MHAYGPKPYGIDFDSTTIDSEKAKSIPIWTLYSQSKAADAILAAEYAKRAIDLAPTAEDGTKKNHVISISLNPGNLKTNLQRHSNTNKIKEFLINMILHPQSLGGLTELYAGLAPETADCNGGFVIPFGRKGSVASYLQKGMEKEDIGKKLWDILEEDVKSYV